MERNLVEINDSDLSFTEEEIHTLLQSLCKIDLSRTQLEGVTEVSGGWAAALICLAELLDSKPAPDQNHLIETFVEQRKLNALDLFIEEEIFNPLKPGEKTMLTRLAGYTSIQAVLVTRLIGEEGIAVLKNLIERNVLLKWVDESLYIFSIHPLFSTFLVEQFQALPSKKKAELYRRAALYFQDHGDHPHQAIHYFILRKEYDKAKEIFQKIAEEFLEQHQYERIHELLVAFPEDFRNKSPILLYYYAITTNLIQPSLSRKTLRKLLAVFKDQGDINREARIYSVLLVNYIFYQGNREAVEELVELSRSFVDRLGSKLDSDRKEVLATLISLGRWWTRPELDNAFEIALRAEETSRRVKDQEILILANLALAKIHLDRGEFQQAKDLLQKTEKLLDRNPAYRHYDALLRFYLGDTFFYLGEIRQAIDQANRGLVQNPGVAFCQYLKLNLILYILYLPEPKSAEPMLEELESEDIGENLFVRYYSMYLLKMLNAYKRDNRHRAEYYCKHLQEPENQKLLQTDYPYSTSDLAEVLFFLGHTDAAIQRLQGLLIIDDFHEKYPYTYATAVALLGYIYHELNQKKESEKLFADLAEVIAQKGYRNLDICNVHLMERICIIRSKTATIPVESCHHSGGKLPLFRAKVATVPVESCHFLGISRNL
ncbi:HTH-type transcriptional regulator MalT [subsurface metagenome]